ncbi:adhesin [Pseudomonas nicosulfuronedens]
MRIFTFCTLALLPLLGYAASQTEQDNSVIDGTGRDYQGNLGVNQAAGNQNQQSNARALANGTGAHASTHQNQQLQLIDPDASLDASASIKGNSFQGSGVVGVNQGAGLGNQQINALRISTSNTASNPQSLDDSVLAQTVAVTRNSGSPVAMPGQRIVNTDDQAFAGSVGVVQVNQSAGVGNQSYNNLSIRVAGGL